MIFLLVNHHSHYFPNHIELVILQSFRVIKKLGKAIITPCHGWLACLSGGMESIIPLFTEAPLWSNSADSNKE